MSSLNELKDSLKEAFAPKACETSGEKPACGCGSFGYGVNIAAFSLAALLFLLCLLTAFVDSSTFINRLYTTAVMWNLPVVTILMIVLSFAINCKRGTCNLLNLIATGLMVLAFLLSNITKNTVQDVVSNADNLVSVAAEAVVDNVDNVEDWKDEVEDAVEDAAKELR